MGTTTQRRRTDLATSLGMQTERAPKRSTATECVPPRAKHGKPSPAAFRPIASVNSTTGSRGFVESFVGNGWARPTPKQKDVFERIADKLGLDAPE